MLGFACLCLLLVGTGTSAEGVNGSIRFPAYSSAAQVPHEGAANSASLKARYPEGIEAVQSIANVVLKVLDNEEVQKSPKNWIVSPLSLAAMIAQLLLGSRGRLQNVLVDSLSLEGGVKPTSRLEVHRQLGRLAKYVGRTSNETYTLEMNGAIFIQPGVTLKTTYKHALLDFYNTQVIPADFLGRSHDTLRQINEWVNASTHGKLPMLYLDPLPPTTISLMANVIFFSGTWQEPFDPDFTRLGAFHINDTHKVDVKYMYGEKELLYKDTPEMQIIGIPYKNWEVVLYVLVPHGRLEGSLSVARLDEIISSAERENITLVMPKIKMLSAISLRQSVFKYLMKNERLATKTVIIEGSQDGKGIKGAASSEPPSASQQRKSAGKRGAAPSAANGGPETGAGAPLADEDGDNFDVGGASEDARFRINDVIHQVSLDIDERGAEIAAVTATLIDYSGDNFILRVDKPFWFFVRHEITSSHLFWGRIVDPSANRN